MDHAVAGFRPAEVDDGKSFGAEAPEMKLVADSLDARNASPGTRIS